MFDRVLMLIEILLLIWIIVQGEYVRFYEREVFRMNKDRFEERKKWRLEKQEQMKKKLARQTRDSSTNLVSALPTEIAGNESKTENAPAAVDPSEPLAPRI